MPALSASRSTRPSDARGGAELGWLAVRPLTAAYLGGPIVAGVGRVQVTDSFRLGGTLRFADLRSSEDEPLGRPHLGYVAAVLTADVRGSGYARPLFIGVSGGIEGFLPGGPRTKVLPHVSDFVAPGVVAGGHVGLDVFECEHVTLFVRGGADLRLVSYTEWPGRSAVAWGTTIAGGLTVRL